MARASRKKRLPISTAVGKQPKWTPGDEVWLKIVSAYNVALDSDMRAEITAIVDKYFENEPFGRNAAFSDSATDWLNGVERAAHAFVEACMSAGGGGGKVYAESMMNEWLQKTDSKAPQPRHMVRAMMDIAFAARASSDEIKSEDHPRFHEKKAWRVMVADLWALAFDNGLPYKINKSGFVDTSPFVAFIRELQASFNDAPSEYAHSDAALTEEISKATRKIRGERKNGKIS